MNPDSDPDWFAEFAIDETGAGLDSDGVEPEVLDYTNPQFGSHGDLAALAAAYSRGPSAAKEWQRRWSDLQEIPVQQGFRSFQLAVFQLAVSRRLTAWAARLLPVVDRPEYEELFRSELYELAQSGGGRRAQLAYALRVLVRAPMLRRELRAPARERSW